MYLFKVGVMANPASLARCPPMRFGLTLLRRQHQQQTTALGAAGKPIAAVVKGCNMRHTIPAYLYRDPHMT